MSPPRRNQPQLRRVHPPWDQARHGQTSGFHPVQNHTSHLFESAIKSPPPENSRDCFSREGYHESRRCSRESCITCITEGAQGSQILSIPVHENKPQLCLVHSPWDQARLCHISGPTPTLHCYLSQERFLFGFQMFHSLLLSRWAALFHSHHF
jgi:hypothetical protein